MYNLSLPNLCATCSSLATLRLPTVDPYSAEVPGKMRSHTVLCGDLYMCLCTDASRTVFWDRSFCQFVIVTLSLQLEMKSSPILSLKSGSN